MNQIIIGASKIYLKKRVVLRACSMNRPPLTTHLKNQEFSTWTETGLLNVIWSHLCLESKTDAENILF